jgi:hypothetical protein
VSEYVGWRTRGLSESQSTPAEKAFLQTKAMKPAISSLNSSPSSGPRPPQVQCAHRELQEQFGYITRQSRAGQISSGALPTDVLSSHFEDMVFAALERVPDGTGACLQRHAFVELKIPVGLTVHKDIKVNTYSAAVVALPMTAEELEVTVRCSKCKQDGLSVVDGALPVLSEHELPNLGIPCRNAGQPIWPEDIACMRHRFWGVDSDDEEGQDDGPVGQLPLPPVGSTIDAASGQVLAVSEVEARLTDGPCWRF